MRRLKQALLVHPGDGVEFSERALSLDQSRRVSLGLHRAVANVSDGLARGEIDRVGHGVQPTVIRSTGLTTLPASESCSASLILSNG